jgi:cytochrome P450
VTVVNSVVTLADLEIDPYGTYARLRRDEPVSFIPGLGQWLVTSWAEVHRVLAEPDMFGADAVPPDARAAIEHDYGPHRVTDFVDTIVRPYADLIAGRLLPAGRAELVGDYFEPVAMFAHAELAGLDPVDARRMRRWGLALVDGGTETELVAAMADLDEAVGPVVERLRARPDGSVIAHLVHAGADLFPVLRHFVQGQLEAGWLAGMTLLGLLGRPEQLAEVRADRWLLGAAVYEALRWGAPVGAVARRTARVVSLGGKELPRGARLAVSLASANRDEWVFPDAHVFDLHRTVRTHLGFGSGAHECPAHAFVPAIARTALDVLLTRMPGLRPEAGWRPAPHGWRLRRPGPVDVEWGYA